MSIWVVANPHARRGGRQALRLVERTLPGARVEITRSVEDVPSVARAIERERPELVLALGGDGTALGLLNALRAARRAIGGSRKGPLTRLGLLKLGTGNGWANAVGAPSPARALERLGAFVERHGASALPTTRFELVEVLGQVTNFAGTGWDAELIDDFHAQKSGPGLIPERARHGLMGYLHGLVTRSIPRNLKLPRVEVEIVNTGAPALGIDRRGRPHPMLDAGPGTVLYRGPASVCGAGTSPQWGFGFRAFPFARLVPGRFNLRMYAATTQEAVARIPLLWAGKHPMPNMHTWMLSSCAVTFSRPVPFQAAGDCLGHHDRVEYTLSDETVDVLDWRALGREVGAPSRLLKDALKAQLEPALAVGGILGD